MNKELTNQLIEAYPDMFGEPKRGPLKRRFHIECGDGWFNILKSLCDDIHAMRPRVLQIKEKFGGLRFYASFPSDYGDQGWKRVRQAEEEAWQTCESCGNPGEMKIIEGWRYTLCQLCADSHDHGVD